MNPHEQVQADGMPNAPETERPDSYEQLFVDLVNQLRINSHLEKQFILASDMVGIYIDGYKPAKISYVDGLGNKILDRNIFQRNVQLQPELSGKNLENMIGPLLWEASDTPGIDALIERAYQLDICSLSVYRQKENKIRSAIYFVNIHKQIVRIEQSSPPSYHGNGYPYTKKFGGADVAAIKAAHKANLFDSLYSYENNRTCRLYFIAGPKNSEDYNFVTDGEHGTFIIPPAEDILLGFAQHSIQGHWSINENGNLANDTAKTLPLLILLSPNSTDREKLQIVVDSKLNNTHVTARKPLIPEIFEIVYKGKKYSLIGNILVDGSNQVIGYDAVSLHYSLLPQERKNELKEVALYRYKLFLLVEAKLISPVRAEQLFWEYADKVLVAPYASTDIQFAAQRIFI